MDSLLTNIISATAEPMTAAATMMTRLKPVSYQILTPCYPWLFIKIVPNGYIIWDYYCKIQSIKKLMYKHEIKKMSHRLIIWKLNFNFTFDKNHKNSKLTCIGIQRHVYIFTGVYIFLCTIYYYIKCKCLLIFHYDTIKEFSLNSPQLASNIRILPVAPSFPVTENFVSSSAIYKSLDRIKKKERKDARYIHTYIYIYIIL